MTDASPRDIPWQPLQRWSLVIGAAGIALWALGWVIGAVTGDEALVRKAFFSYLFAFSFGLAIPLGCLAIWMLHNQTGGAWGWVVRRTLESGTRILPVMAVLFVPIALGLPWLYLWADTANVEDEHLREIMAHRAGYMNAPWFLIRTAIYFAIWIGLALRLNQLQAAIDREPSRALARKQQVFSGPGLLFFGLSVTFAAIDWIMSLEPDWYSTIFGFLYAAGQIVPALAFAIAVAICLSRYRPLAEERIEPEVWNDLGNLLLAAVMFWAYLSFSQLLLIWSGNLRGEGTLTGEIGWYLRRSSGGWNWVGTFLAAFYFGLPFALLLSRRLKREPRRLLALCTLLVAVSVVQHFWLVTPAYAWLEAGRPPDGGGLTLHPLDLAALVGVGGLAFAAFVWQLRSRPITPHPYLVAEEAAHA